MPVLPTPLISRGLPAFTNDDFSGAFPADHANNSVYGGSNYWRCATEPVGGTDSGTLTMAVYLAYDLSSIASGLTNVCLNWYNDPQTDEYNPGFIGHNSFNIPSGYTVQVNAAAGGSYPVAGWSTVVTVASSPYHSRHHNISFSGKNWIQILITDINGSSLNNNAAINMDIHNTSGGDTDSWLMLGDSITQRGLDHDDLNLGPILAAQINALVPTNFPAMEDGGIGGLTAADAAANIATWLGVDSSRYITLNYGTNDANAGGAPFTNFSANMTTCINAVLGAGRIPVIPKIPWGSTANLLANVPTLNSEIDTLYTTFPQIVHGPDLYSFFNANQSLISGDGIHPTDPAGYTAYRQQWAQALVTNLYAPSSVGSPFIIYKKVPGRILV